MGQNRFVPLHNHSQYSFLDGYSSVEGMARKAKELGMPAIALTDHGEVSGHVAFQDACEEVGIKPIFGMEGYLVDDVKRVREEKDRVNSHLCLFAETQEGLSNLWALSTEAYMNKYYKPLADWEILAKYSKGLIVSDGCMLTNISRNIIADKMDEAKEIVAKYLSILGEGNFFMELHTWQFTDPGSNEEYLQLNREMSKINQGKVEIAREMGVPLIVVNDSHFTEEEDWVDHDLVWAMSTNSDQTERGKTAAWIMSDEEIYYWMSRHGISRQVTEEAIKNTSAIAKRCNAEIRPQIRTPRITNTQEGDLELYKKKVEDGFRRKVLESGKSDEEVQRYRERMEYENSLIIDKEFYGYFNVVADYCLVPDTPVLTADLRWVPIGSLEVGQKIAGFDEESTLGYSEAKKKYRYWREGEVLSTKRVSLPCYEVTLSDGTKTVASEGHMWLVFKGERARPAEWVRTKDLLNFGNDKRYSSSKKLTVKAFKLTEMWESEGTWEEGYIAGILDGEGWFSTLPYVKGGEVYQFSVAFAQNPGAVLDTAKSILTQWGYNFKERPGSTHEICILGPRVSALSLLGKVRPQRFMERVDLNRFGRLESIDRPEVLSVEYVGIREVVAVETTTSTLIAQGFAHHNCQYAKMADPEAKFGPIKGKKPWLVGPARGSAGGTLVAYLMDITEIDPMEYGLMFERFLTRGRGARVTLKTDQGDHRFVIGDKVQLKSGEVKLVQNVQPGDDVDLEATSQLNL